MARSSDILRQIQGCTCFPGYKTASIITWPSQVKWHPYHRLRQMSAILRSRGPSEDGTFAYNALLRKMNWTGPLLRKIAQMATVSAFLSPYNCRYADLLPLHELWKDYMRSVLTGGELKDERLLKADYHGCLVHVTRARTASQVGIHGILVRESRNTFLLVTPSDRVLSKLHISAMLCRLSWLRNFTNFSRNFGVPFHVDLV